MDATELFKILEPIKVGGSVCRYSLSKCEELAPLINEIEALKKEKNATILAHSYVSPEILFSVADFTGDSYKLSQEAQKRGSDVILFVAVRFMAETAKILNPSKRVFVASDLWGCSLADSITKEKVLELRRKYPDYTFVCYINTSAEVKANCDVCVTSSNVYDIVENVENDRVYFLPDKLMGENLANEMKRRGSKKEIKFYEEGLCYVHEQYDPEMLETLRMEYEDLKILAHPECHPEVIKRSDFVGSTGNMVKYIEERGRKGSYLMLTECGLLDRVLGQMPEVKFVGSCVQCKYMRSNTLYGIRETLKTLPSSREIFLNEETINLAKKSVEAMFFYSDKSVK